MSTSFPVATTEAVSASAPRFRRMDSGDSPAMHALEKRCFSLPWSEEQCRAAFSQKAFAAFGLWRGTALIAYISFYHTADELEILNLAVCPEERRKGFGRRVLRQVLQVACKMDIQNVLLEVRRSNRAAIALYESCGFRQAGTRPRYYSDTNEDALIYLHTIQNSL
ncbi:MAG: ribosomal protein S18-alanine N-acetyltransferase [Desulfovibrionaceae bacterium]|nr:ribosomal protein S18-alanine N-acetyltransferase [Desulfovibrionaceae bacterium]